ncbi:FdrA family protein [Pedococcus sp. 5OH_020]|uniref:FdrA family protein n=1 Tax=Pedococcus sp. 5OH_020 TaxID=2989814 RepID=UPI0022E9AA1B|nr:FdrA family protein [Pedococcus sp. 5OH_020]
MTEHLEVRGGAYYDSVSLMTVSRQVTTAPGVSAAQVALATELNLEVLAGMGFTVPGGTQPNDLVVAIRATDQAGVDAGLSALDQALASLHGAGARAEGLGQILAPRTLGAAIARGSASVALVSVPGQYATIEAWDALERGVSVMLFSDNVPVEHEVALKDAAASRDLLVMGPDCGTAVVGGVGLGFANVVRAGPVGIVAASGTGAQQVMALLDAAGTGVSHCLGVGGRDLSTAVGGRSTRQALAALAADVTTEVILVVSKPPAPEVLADLQRYAAALDTPVRWATLGAGRPDLTTAVEEALRARGVPVPQWPAWRGASSGESADGFLRGLFCGGTLADEAMLVVAEALGDVWSNVPLRPDLALGADLHAPGHVVVDFGDDRLTRGRAHPMIDPTLRLERIAAEATDPTCGVLVLDLVLGHGAHPDPAPELAQAVGDARATAVRDGRRLPVVVSLTGTDGDPQAVSRCADTLVQAGATVMLSNAQAARHAVGLLGSGVGR